MHYQFFNQETALESLRIGNPKTTYNSIVPYVVQSTGDWNNPLTANEQMDTLYGFFTFDIADDAVIEFGTVNDMGDLVQLSYTANLANPQRIWHGYMYVHQIVVQGGVSWQFIGWKINEIPYYKPVDLGLSVFLELQNGLLPPVQSMNGVFSGGYTGTAVNNSVVQMQMFYNDASDTQIQAILPQLRKGADIGLFSDQYTETVFTNETVGGKTSDADNWFCVYQLTPPVNGESKTFTSKFAIYVGVDGVVSDGVTGAAITAVGGCTQLVGGNYKAVLQDVGVDSLNVIVSVPKLGGASFAADFVGGIVLKGCDDLGSLSGWTDDGFGNWVANGGGAITINCSYNECGFIDFYTFAP